MPSITLDQAEARLTLYLAAEQAVLGGQSYTIGSRSLSRANISEIRAGIEYWNGKVSALSETAAGRSRVRTVRPGW